MIEFISNMLNNDKGFFQGGKSFGGKGISGVLGDFKKKFKDKPFAGQPGVCPYTGKPLQTPTEKQNGVADEVSTQMVGKNAVTGRDIIATPEGLQNPYVQQQLQSKQDLINQVGGLSSLSGVGALQGQNVSRMQNLGGYYL